MLDTLKQIEDYDNWLQVSNYLGNLYNNVNREVFDLIYYGKQDGFYIDNLTVLERKQYITYVREALELQKHQNDNLLKDTSTLP